MQWIILQSQKTAAEIEAQLLASFTSVGLPTDAWVKGDIWDNLTKWIAQLLVLVYTLILYIAQGAFLATASGNLLTDLAAGTFGTARRTETFATGPFTLTNGGLDPIDEPIDSLTFENTADTTITYRNAEAVYILPGNSQTFDIVCDVAGTIGNALTSTVSMTTTIVGATGTNASPIAGQDAQEDDDLRNLASKQASNLSDGAVDKYEWEILNLNTDGTTSVLNDGKTRVNVNRVSVTNDSANGIVTVVLASPSGAVDAGEYATCTAKLIQVLQGNPGTLDDYNAAPITVDIDVDVELKKGTGVSGYAAIVEQYIADWFVSSDNGISGDNGTLTVKELETIIGRASLKIREVSITAINGGGPANVTLAFDEVAVLGTFTVNITVQA